MVYLEELMLREEDGMDGEVTVIESDHEEDDSKDDDDDIEVLSTCPR